MTNPTTPDAGEGVYTPAPAAAETRPRCCWVCGSALPEEADRQRTTCDLRCRSLGSLLVTLERSIMELRPRLTSERRKAIRAILWRTANLMNEPHKPHSTSRYSGGNRGGGSRRKP